MLQETVPDSYRGRVFGLLDGLVSCWCLWAWRYSACGGRGPPLVSWPVQQPLPDRRSHGRSQSVARLTAAFRGAPVGSGAQ